MSVTTNILRPTMSMLEMYRSPPCLTSSGCCPCAKRIEMRRGSRWNVCQFLSRSTQRIDPTSHFASQTQQVPSCDKTWYTLVQFIGRALRAIPEIYCKRRWLFLQRLLYMCREAEKWLWLSVSSIYFRNGLGKRREVKEGCWRKVTSERMACRNGMGSLHVQPMIRDDGDVLVGPNWTIH
ncbi:hypothetical protein M378DRAFT_539960 [Amanita muscaria Koide BX008]|uniref:Uncharacterized protein n=1 Tax=Amanita muscaria (strain Koide BX008) TaxID=946122 RepID=A0A0C2W4U4_AMAMK|nr:hypothetical protein M378DRAFT_539960 [Amanita muscaria Koide BX008]